MSQAQVYPKSPESTIFDEILIQNMFSLGTSLHCILVSPLFWTFVIITLAGIILVVMIALKLWIAHPKKHVWRAQIKAVFRQIDLVVSSSRWTSFSSQNIDLLYDFSLRITHFASVEGKGIFLTTSTRRLPITVECESH